MNPKEPRDEFMDVGERLRSTCTPATQLRLDELKVRIQRQAQRTRQNRGLFMRRRSVATVLSILGLAVTGIGAAVLVGQDPQGPSADASRAQYENRGARSEGAPGRFCMAQGARPGSRAFRECVRLAAAARGRAQNGNKRGGNPNSRRADAPGRFCQASGANPGSRAFSECVTLAAKAQRAARGRS